MVNQKLISFKIDVDLLDQVDSYCLYNDAKRNRVINDFLRIGLSNLSHYMLCRLIADHCQEYGLDWKSFLDNRGSFDF